MTATPALAVESVTVRFGGRVALDDVSLRAEAGAVTGIIGPNGAGKTTLFNVVCGMQRAERGRVRLRGEDITSTKTHKRARLGLSRTFQRLELFGALSAVANVRVAAGLGHHADPHTTALEMLDRVGARHLADVRADELPTGQARLVELARALATEPHVLLLDEPASGLDEGETAPFGSLLRELASEGMAVVLVEHDVPLVLEVCDEVHVLDVGAVLASGPPSTIRADERVHEAYLGAMELA